MLYNNTVGKQVRYWRIIRLLGRRWRFNPKSSKYQVLLNQLQQSIAAPNGRYFQKRIRWKDRMLLRFPIKFWRLLHRYINGSQIAAQQRLYWHNANHNLSYLVETTHNLDTYIIIERHSWLVQSNQWIKLENIVDSWLQSEGFYPTPDAHANAPHETLHLRKLGSGFMSVNFISFFERILYAGKRRGDGGKLTPFSVDWDWQLTLVVTPKLF
jgi:hypothetical protein